ncbi:uncharacterized protein LOC131630833 [Vicia villosa]|uniref:uncharacterized protein LOC131630833 n=1 Tax=Vicia villosa TaxID=3911 RepID=UPI00273C2DD3|nr:uncharacterized protein LOC131630833 [Vicia villosa]
MAQELIRGYGRKHISPRCMVQMDVQKAYDTVEWSALHHIMLELGFPHIYVNWIMACVTTGSYRFSINGTPSKILKAKRGLRQGDPISPLLFVLVMEYFHRILQGLCRVPNFNFHPKCEKLKIINLCFADDILMFVRGDLESVKLIMDKVRGFSASTGLQISIPKRRTQLLKSVIFSIANYWMQIFPLPKKVIDHINSICRSFLWTGKEHISRKAPVAWDHLSNPIAAGGLNLISLMEWNKATVDPLTYYPDIHCSWILKAMFKHRDDLVHTDIWKDFCITGKYITRKVYNLLRGEKPKVTWRKLFYGNLARPRAKFNLWMTCMERLPTKDRLQRFGVINDGMVHPSNIVTDDLEVPEEVNVDKDLVNDVKTMIVAMDVRQQFINDMSFASREHLLDWV